MVEDAGLHGDVERAGRFIGDDQVGFARERDRDQNALTLTSGEFVWVAADALGGVVEARFGESVDHLVTDLGSADTTQFHGFGDLDPDALSRVQPHHRVLRDESDHRTTQSPNHFLLGAGDLHTADLDRSRRHSPVGGQQPDDRVRGGGLAGTRLADDRNHLAGIHLQIQAVDGGRHLPVPSVTDVQATDVDDRDASIRCRLAEVGGHRSSS